MNISALFSGTSLLQNYAALSQRTSVAPGLSTFVSGSPVKQGSETNQFIQGPDIHLRMKGENCIYSGGRCGSSGAFQDIYAEYTADSTEVDPIVRITGTADSGKFDFTRHIRDIDPSNASYAELAALYGHLCRTGAYQTNFKEQAGTVLPCGVEPGDISQKRNYLKKIEDLIGSASKSGVYPKFGSTTYAHARELLKVYQDFAQTREGHAAAARQAASQVPAFSAPRSASRESAFSQYLDVDCQRQNMRELPPGQMLSSVYMQFMDDYRNWKAQQPETILPDSQGWTVENLAFLRERCSRDLSAFEIYDALETMQELGILSEKAKNRAAGSCEVRINLSESGVWVVPNLDADSTAAWLHGFDEAPMVGFHSLDDIISWAKEFREEDYPDFITHTEALAQGWV